MRLPPFAKKWMWFVALWVGGVATVTVVAYAIRLLILPG